MESFNPGFVSESLVKHKIPEPHTLTESSIESKLEGEDDIICLDNSVVCNESIPENKLVNTPLSIKTPKAKTNRRLLLIDTNNRSLESPVDGILSNSPTIKSRSAGAIIPDHKIAINLASEASQRKSEIEQISSDNTLTHRIQTLPMIIQKKTENEIKSGEEKEPGCWASIANCLKVMSLFSTKINSMVTPPLNQLELSSNLNPFSATSPTPDPRGLKQQ